MQLSVGSSHNLLGFTLIQGHSKGPSINCPRGRVLLRMLQSTKEENLGKDEPRLELSGPISSIALTAAPPSSHGSLSHLVDTLPRAQLNVQTLDSIPRREEKFFPASSQLQAHIKYRSLPLLPHVPCYAAYAAHEGPHKYQ